MDDTVSFLRFYYPSIKANEWRYDTLNMSDRFQVPSLNLDCGFHMLNFMHAAIKNTRVPISHKDFNAFKTRTNNTLLKLQNKTTSLQTEDTEPDTSTPIRTVQPETPSATQT